MKNLTRRKFVAASTLAAAGLALPGRSHAAAEVVLDPATAGRVFEGIGALSAGASSRLLIDYPEPQRSQVLDLLFAPSFGASLHHCKVEIGGDVNSTDGVEPSHMHSRDDLNLNRGYEWWLMKEAKKRAPTVFLDTLPWGAPGWIGGGKYYSQDMADYIVKFIQGAKEVHGLDIDYTGIWNEVTYDREWIKLLKRTLKAAGLTTKLVAADQTPWHPGGLWGIADDMMKDPELRDAVDVIGGHYPFYKNYQSTETARNIGKPLWASEDGFSQKRVSCDDWAAAMWLARFYNMNYIGGRMVKTIVWSTVSSYYDNFPYRRSGLMVANSPWSGHFEDSPPLWTTAHTTQFAQPGWTYLDGACSRLKLGGSVVALKSPAGADWSAIIETGGARFGQRVDLRVAGGLSDAPVSVWRTNPKESFVKLDETKPAGGVVSLALDPDSVYSLTTTTGQQKGGYASPNDEGFPLPYADDFSGYAAGATPKYFSDWFGVFETAAASGRPCLQQVVTQKPIDWGFVKNGDPRTFVGGAEWTDYQVSVDADPNGAEYVSVFGRISKIGMSSLPGKYYELRLRSDGSWSLSTGTRTLKQGRVEAKTGWRRLGLKFVGNRVTALIDGREVTSVWSMHSPRGQAGVGCGLGPARFAGFGVGKV